MVLNAIAIRTLNQHFPGQEGFICELCVSEEENGVSDHSTRCVHVPHRPKEACGCGYCSHFYLSQRSCYYPQILNLLIILSGKLGKEFTLKSFVCLNG